MYIDMNISNIVCFISFHRRILEEEQRMKEAEWKMLEEEQLRLEEERKQRKEGIILIYNHNHMHTDKFEWKTIEMG